jgi:hypothetical protein
MGNRDSAARHISEAHTHPKPYLSSCRFDLSFSLEDFLSILRCNVNMGYLSLLALVIAPEWNLIGLFLFYSGSSISGGSGLSSVGSSSACRPLEA